MIPFEVAWIDGWTRQPMAPEGHDSTEGRYQKLNQEIQVIPRIISVFEKVSIEGAREQNSNKHIEQVLGVVMDESANAAKEPCRSRTAAPTRRWSSTL